ncbi:acylphosphatase [Microbulbifer thermotolerans]|uniref:acylphosphatase n=1 Tax=Microbulbifer thermotolerans TaxID=252514 RepID=UPI0026729A30|nr:acylphosphatase [Microbulbifer thermotolerans]WKT59445.1 acylphosphatase [Microbulbifer thermotolerans]
MDISFPAGLEEITERENNYEESPHLHSRSVGISLISAAAEKRGLNVNMHRGLVYEISDENRRVLFLQNSPENSTVFSYCARKKHLAKILLARRGVQVPAGEVFTRYDDALQYFEHCPFPVALKPVDGAHGTGVSADVSTVEEFQIAWKNASASAREVIVEQSIKGYDLRVIVIGGSAVAAYIRIPANVVGDGISTIAELVDRKNERRKLNPSLRIDMLKRFDLLERQGRSLNDVPAENERVWLTSVANVSVGGEVVQCIDHINPSVLRVAEEAARAFPGLPQVGVDLMLDDSGERERIWVIEVNSNPGISDAVFPGYGRPVDVPDALLDFVFKKQPQNTGTTDEYPLVLAEPYTYATCEPLLSKNTDRQVELIKQAAYACNLTVEDLADNLYVLSSQHNSVTFYKGLPDRTNVISRKASRNRRWLLELLQQRGVFASVHPSDRAPYMQYRLVVVNNTLVAGVSGGIHSGKKGEKCRFDRGNRDVSDEIHPGFARIAIEAVNATFNPFIAGIDLIATDIRRSPDRQTWKVNDVLCHPNLSLHHFPDCGLGRDLAGVLIRALFPELANQSLPNRCVFATIEGRVQGVGFRNWLERQAVLHAVHGWARNTPDGKVEVFMEGREKAVDALLALCELGPPAASVSGISLKEYPSAGLQTFIVRR